MGEITQTTMCIFWAAAIILFGIAEAVTAQLVSIWFVAGSVAALIAGLCNAPLIVQAVVFLAVTIFALVITRPLVKKYIRPKKEHTNADKVIGQVGIVAEDIDNIKATGQVKVDGKIWTARSIDNSVIPTGSEIIIDRIEGVKLMVKNKE